jgi:hypothetical protein
MIETVTLRALTGLVPSLPARILASIALASLSAGCGGPSGRHVARLTSTARTTTGVDNVAPSEHASDPVAFSRCMRAHGVPDYPDPGSDGTIPKESLQQLGVGLPRFQAAQSACQRLLPNGGGGPTPVQLQAERGQALDFARCVRAHGVPNMPDPDGSGRIPDPATAGINQGSPAFEAANRACAKWRPPYMPSNAAYNAYARTHGG